MFLSCPGPGRVSDQRLARRGTQGSYSARPAGTAGPGPGLPESINAAAERPQARLVILVASTVLGAN
eukprot:489883-Hanusia_phi.AAC.5